MFSRARNPFLTLLLSYHVRVTLKIQVNFQYKRFSEVLMILSYEFPQFLQYLCFQGQGIHCWHSYWATMFGWPRKSRSTSGTRGTRRYWWLSLINFWNFFTIYVFEVKESIADIPTELPYSGDLENPGQLPVQEVLRGTDDFVMNFHNFFSIYVFEVKESIADIPTEQPCSGDLENQVNFRFKRFSDVLMILSCEFPQFFQYLCFRGQGIHCWHSYWAIMFGWPRKSRSTSGSSVHGSSVGMSDIDSSTSKTLISKKIMWRNKQLL